MSIEAEQSLLGGLMLDSSLADEVQVSPQDFESDEHALIYRAIRDLRLDGEPADVVTLSEKLGDKVRDVGGVSYLGDLAQNTPRIENIPAYAEIVRKNGRNRHIKIAAGEVFKSLDQGNDPDQVIGQFITSVEASTESKAHRVGDPVGKVMELGRERAERAKGDGVPGIPSHIPSLNHMTGGALEPDVWCIAGRPSVGKTALGIGWCREAARRGYKAAYFSLEMPRTALLTRLCAAAYSLDLHKLTTGDEETLKELSEKSEDRPVDYSIWIDDSSYGIEEIVMRMAMLKRKENIDLIVIDHLGLIEPPNSSLKKSEASQIGDVTRLIHKAAKQNNIPVIILHQLNREIEKEDRWPRMSDLRDSGKIEQDMDVVCFLHMERQWKYEATRPIHIGVGKQRNGPVGWLNKQIKFFGNVQQHREISYG